MISKHQPLVTTHQFQNHNQKWHEIFQHGENLSLIFAPLEDRQFRIKQWLDTNQKDFFPIFINPSLSYSDDFEEYQDIINQKLPTKWRREDLASSLNKTSSKIIIISLNAEEYIKPKNAGMLSYLQELLLKFPQYFCSLSTFETNIFRHSTLISHHNLVFQNIVYYPLYDDKNSNQIISYLEKKWIMTIPKTTKKSILKSTGGSFWLIKEACRIFRDTNKWNSITPSFQFRLKSLAESLTTSEIFVLTHLPKNLKQYQHTFRHLTNLGYIVDNKLTVPELLPHLAQIISKHSSIVEKDQRLFYKDIPLDSMLSSTEYMLLYTFFTHPNQPISRDRIAKILWSHEQYEKYSLWAIDQAVKRLRDRLTKLNLPSTMIKTIRGVGYEYRKT